jgi:hypothetical protein
MLKHSSDESSSLFDWKSDAGSLQKTMAEIERAASKKKRHSERFDLISSTSIDRNFAHASQQRYASPATDRIIAQDSSGPHHPEAR